MLNELIPAMRAQLRDILPENAFIRRDRGEGLFITNAPVFAPDIADIPGFIAEREGRLMRLLPDERWIMQLEAQAEVPPDHLSASLARFKGERVDRDGLALFAQGAKLLDAGANAPEDEICAFDRNLRRRAALALRGESKGGLYAAALIYAQIHSII